MKKKFNIIDLIIVLLLLLCAVGIFFRMKSNSNVSKSADTVNVEISVLVEGISKSSTSAFVIGDDIYWEGVKLGTLKSVDVSHATAYIADENGECKSVELDDRCNVRFILSSQGSYTESGFMVGGTTYIAPGKSCKIYSLNVTTNGTVMEISEVTQQ